MEKNNGNALLPYKLSDYRNEVWLFGGEFAKRRRKVTPP